MKFTALFFLVAFVVASSNARVRFLTRTNQDSYIHYHTTIMIYCE